MTLDAMVSCINVVSKDGNCLLGTWQLLPERDRSPP